MAARPDSIETLKTINVPTLLVTGDEDAVTGVNEAELMRQHIPGSQLRVITKAGHYSPWEQPAEVGKLVNLRTLFAQKNQLSSLPAELGQLMAAAPLIERLAESI